jgi:hypothetical protein
MSKSVLPALALSDAPPIASASKRLRMLPLALPVNFQAASLLSQS